MNVNTKEAQRSANNRSTIIGNFVANVNEAVGHRVTRINFLGDWGTQFGMLAAGLERRGVDVEYIISDKNGGTTTNNAIQRLNEVYVEANSIAEKEPAFSERAKELFRDLEAGSEDLLRQWKIIRNGAHSLWIVISDLFTCFTSKFKFDQPLRSITNLRCCEISRQLTVDALEKVYDRLNVKFDKYDGESMYAASEEHTSRVMNLLGSKNLLQQLEDGREAEDSLLVDWLLTFNQRFENLNPWLSGERN